MTHTTLAAAIFTTMLLSTPAPGPAEGMLGNWSTRDHSVVRVYECGTRTLCARLIQTVDPNSIDELNPDKHLRNRRICGVQLGKDLAVIDVSHAHNGKFYDPNTGKTYRAEVTLDGDLLKVRGYVGVALFGRSESWHRTSDDLPICKP